MYEGPRGVYWFWIPNAKGKRAWFALDSQGHMIAGVRSPLPYESDAQVVADLAEQLERIDPVVAKRPEYLKLLATATSEPPEPTDVSEAIIPPCPVPSEVSTASVLLAARIQRGA